MNSGDHITTGDNIGTGIAIGNGATVSITTIYQWARQAPADPQTVAAAQALLATLPGDGVPDVDALPAGSRMPYRANPLFVGRAGELQQIAAALVGQQTIAIGQPAAVTGLGGSGKSTLAVEFAQRYGRYFAGGVYWLSCADPALLATEVAACGGAGLVDHPAWSDLKLPDQLRLVQQAWAEAIPRPLIFDNCEAEELLAQWRPPTGGCRILVTSRRATWSASLGVTALPLDVLARNQSIELMGKHRPDLHNHPALDAIAAELGDLPLALHLAGSYLETYRDDPTFGDPAAFLTELCSAGLLDHGALQGIDATPSPTNHDLHVARTFALSLDRLAPADPTDATARALLARAALLAPGEPIPRAFLLATLALDAEDRAWPRQAVRALNRLSALGLLEVDGDGALQLHRLLAAYAQRECADAGAVGTVEQALLDVLNERQDTAGYVAAFDDLLAHLRHLTDAALERGDERAARLAGNLAGLLPAADRRLRGGAPVLRAGAGD